MNKKYFLMGGALVVAAGMGWFLFVGSNEVSIEKGQVDLARMSLPPSDLSGERCEHAKIRPVAVMMAGDSETRPLSGIAEADLVWEMPVTDGGVTRMMAVFQCQEPTEIGSVRSSRLDFIPLAQGLGAVYAHWGGEKEALKQLNRGIIANLDGLRYDGQDTVYYRKKGLKPPHNGFTSYNRLEEEVVKKGLNLPGSTVIYPHEEGKSLGRQSPPEIYAKEFAVSWKYQAETNNYRRWRGGELEMDLNLNRPVEAKNVVIIKTTWSPIDKDYIRVKTIGFGETVIYKNGQAINGTWEKKGAKEKLFFFDENKQEIKFVPGPIWIEITIL